MPARLIELLRSDLPLPDKKHKLDQIILRYSNRPSPFIQIFVKYFLKLSLFRLHKRDSEKHPTIQIVNDHVSEMKSEEVDLFNIKGRICKCSMKSWLASINLSLLDERDIYKII